MAAYFGARGSALAHLIATVAGLDFFLFGYDQGVTGGLLELQSFRKRFTDLDPFQYRCPDAPPGEEFTACPAGNQALYQLFSNYQAIAVASYNLGCLLGAIACIWIGDFLGRRKTIFAGSLIMLVGAIIQASSFSSAQLIFGRIVTGIGNGLNTSTVPTWQSETSKTHQRGPMVMIEGMLITAGVAFSYWLDFGFRFMGHEDISWRFPLAFQAVFAVIILTTVLGLPESPRWLIMKGREEEAKQVLSALQEWDMDSSEMQLEIQDVSSAVSEAKRGSFRQLFTMEKDTRHLHRTVLAYLAQTFQQSCGINLITYYAPVIYGTIGMSGYMPALLTALNGTEYFMASLLAIYLVERVGRRPMMLAGSAGMCVSMIALTVLSKLLSSGNKAAGTSAAVFLFVFNTFFAIGWLGMSWLYPAEIVPTRIRGPACALSTSANWTFNFLVVMISPIAFAHIGAYTYLIFAVVNAGIIPIVYFFFPETKGRQLEAMDAIFANSGWCTAVKASLNETGEASALQKRQGSANVEAGDGEEVEMGLREAGERSSDGAREEY